MVRDFSSTKIVFEKKMLKMVTSLITQRSQTTLNFFQTPSLCKVMMRGSVGLVPPLLQLRGAGGTGGTGRVRIFFFYTL